MPAQIISLQLCFHPHLPRSTPTSTRNRTAADDKPLTSDPLVSLPSWPMSMERGLRPKFPNSSTTSRSLPLLRQPLSACSPCTHTPTHTPTSTSTLIPPSCAKLESVLSLYLPFLSFLPSSPVPVQSQSRPVPVRSSQTRFHIARKPARKPSQSSPSPPNFPFPFPLPLPLRSRPDRPNNLRPPNNNHNHNHNHHHHQQTFLPSLPPHDCDHFFSRHLSVLIIYALPCPFHDDDSSFPPSFLPCNTHPPSLFSLTFVLSSPERLVGRH
ncbi:hypothetical protein BKA65DRAFT_245932 [Rhexocercosporidium sp. MPI-PUGE-AT-0058]|nr:hypothetical protein BKA65DRAFT_245932 [Rhexocercosporidium sp. MPI-PUGE-AT-0058]